MCTLRPSHAALSTLNPTLYSLMPPPCVNHTYLACLPALPYTRDSRLVPPPFVELDLTLAPSYTLCLLLPPPLAYLDPRPLTCCPPHCLPAGLAATLHPRLWGPGPGPGQPLQCGFAWRPSFTQHVASSDRSRG